MDSMLTDGFQIGEWQVSPEDGKITGPNGTQHVEPKVMDVLMCLAGNAGRVVSRETLLTEVWKGRAVSDEPLSRCIAELRRHFGDSRGESRYIETIHKRGYKLVAAISSINDSFRQNDGQVESTAAHDIRGWPQDASPRFAGFDIVRWLGEGTMAKVFLARESALDRLVAVKVLRPELSSDPLARERFEREAKTAARISHPNVTAIYRVGELSNGTPFIATEYIEGRNLAQYVATSGPISIKDGRRILKELASALACADAKRVIHRDVKPGNVLIENQSGRIVLGDFGIAGIQETGGTAARRLTREGEQLGDPKYASPEHIRGESLTARSDIYSFGVLAYELLAGRGPFDVDDYADLPAAHVQADPVDLISRRKDVPELLARMIHSCLSKTPEERPSASEFLKLLDDAEADRTDREVPTFDSTAIDRRTRAIRIVVGLAFALLGLFLAWQILT